MRHFKIYEFVSENVYKVYGDSSVRFFDDRLLVLADFLRELLGVPLVINDWYWKGKNHQRGLRENISQIVKSKGNKLYLSSHCFGRAFDCVSSKMSAKEMRRIIEKNADKLPFNVRIESDKSAPTWLHIELNMNPTNKKITYFDA